MMAQKVETAVQGWSCDPMEGVILTHTRARARANTKTASHEIAWLLIKLFVSVKEENRGLAVRGSAVNHVQRSGSTARWPRGFSWTMFVHQEWSRDRLADSTHARCRFCPVSGSFHGFTAWAGLRKYVVESARNVQKCSVFRTTLKAHFQRGSRLLFKIEPRSLYLSMVRCSVSCWTTYS